MGELNKNDYFFNSKLYSEKKVLQIDYNILKVILFVLAIASSLIDI